MMLLEQLLLDIDSLERTHSYAGTRTIICLGGAGSTESLACPTIRQGPDQSAEESLA